MAKGNSHLRNTFLAGIFAGVPLAVTVFIIWWIDTKTTPISQAIFRRNIPFIGIVLSLVAIYLLGLIVTSFFGQYVLSLLDMLLSRMPVVKPFYEAWKQVSLTPGGKEGMYSRVVLVPLVPGGIHMLGFTSGQPIPASPDICCVLVPNSPNPISGRLYFVSIADLRFVEMSPEEALKTIVSIGNYVPVPIGEALSTRKES